MNNTIIYEQPLNEVIRVCLRLEYLLQQIDHQLNDLSLLGSHNVIALIVNVLQLLERPDLKAKLAKELTHHLTNLMRFGNAPNIDADKLQKLVEQLEDLNSNFINSSGKIGQRLRDIELLNNLRLHLASPGGGCSFDIPVYYHWLQQPDSLRRSTILHWLGEFTAIRTAIDLVLDLIRQNAKIQQKMATHGFHQELLDPQSNLRMIRVGIERDISAFPEMSIGRHFLSVRFFSSDIEKRPAQYPHNLTFWLAYCNT